MHLNEKSKSLTTFRTPFGRYCWLRLPFGLNVAQDIFQRRMDEILEDLPGVVSISDDVCVYGENEEDHDANLIGLMERAAENGLVFNSPKCAIKKRQISLFGNTYSEAGIKPDKSKIQDILQMPRPDSKEDLHRFLRMLNYLSQFIPKFADKTHPLRELLKQNTPWIWDSDYDVIYESLKREVTEHSCLKYYDTTKPVSLEVDASQKGLGAALVQDGRPVAFASKTLTETQSNYSNIERETLAIVHGIQRFHTYLFGRSFTVVTDHKPLMTICYKAIPSGTPKTTEDTS